MVELLPAMVRPHLSITATKTRQENAVLLDWWLAGHCLVGCHQSFLVLNGHELVRSQPRILIRLAKTISAENGVIGWVRWDGRVVGTHPKR